MHADAYAYVARSLGRHPVARGASVVEIGARNINGTVRSLFAPYAGVRYLGTDIAAGPGVDVVEAGECLRLEAPVDLVVCCEVLEHTAAAPAIVHNAARLLKPGGRVLLTMAGPGRAPHSAVDGGPVRPLEFYRNVSTHEIREWLEAAGFEAIEVEYNRAAGDTYATAVRGEA
jgi:SAM-dependent methyltransferase